MEDKKSKSPKRIVFNLSVEDEKLLTSYQLKQLQEKGEKPSYTEIVNEITGFNIENLREFLKKRLEE